MDVLLRANAVNYTVKAQGVPALAFGGRRQQQGPRLAEAVGGLIGKGVEVYVVSDDLAERGLQSEELVGGIKMVRKAEALHRPAPIAIPEGQGRIVEMIGRGVVGGGRLGLGCLDRIRHVLTSSGAQRSPQATHGRPRLPRGGL